MLRPEAHGGYLGVSFPLLRLTMQAGRSRTVIALGLAQTLAWASSYYLPAMLAQAMARTLGVGAPDVFAAFSVALVMSALVGSQTGRQLSDAGGRAAGAGRHQPPRCGMPSADGN